MTNALTSSINQFQEAVLHGASIAFDHDGNWHERHPITVFFRKIFGFEKSDTLELAKNYARYLDTLSVPSSHTRSGFTGDAISSVDRKKATDAIHERLTPYLLQEEKGQKAAPDEKKLYDLQKQAQAQAVWRRIRRAEIALSPTSSPTSDNQEWMAAQIKEWKKKHSFRPAKELPEWEKQMVERACLYPEFIKELKDDPFLKREFLTVLLRNTYGANDMVDIFIQMPKVQRRLTKSYLDMRVRRVGSHVLRLVEQEGKKDAQFLVHGKYVSIHDITNPAKIESHGESKSIAELLKMFKQQNIAMPTWEVVKNGLVYTNTQKPHFDSSREEWYNTRDEYVQYTKEDVQARLEKSGYKKDSLPHSIVFIKASRSSKKLTPDGNHAWLEVLVPQKDGSFAGQSYGLFASSYPQPGALPGLLFTFKTHEGVIASPDANEVNFAREHVEIPLILDSKEMFDYTMNQILLPDLLKARRGQMIFQGQGNNNCAGWVQSVVNRLYKQFNPEKAPPKLFELSIEDLDMPEPVKLIAKNPYKSLFNAFLNGIRIALSAFAGAAEQHKHALIKNRFWQEGKQNLPANLFRVQEKTKQIYVRTAKTVCSEMVTVV